MKPSSVQILTDERDGARVSVRTFSKRGERIEFGVLDWEESGTQVPICKGFPLFSHLRTGQSPLTCAQLHSLAEELNGSHQRSMPVSAHRPSRPDTDRRHAAIPFGGLWEDTNRLLHLLEGRMDTGSLVVVAGCQTGWFAERLALMFPHAHVVLVADPHEETLGFSGWSCWLGSGSRADNLEVVFQGAEASLPVKKHAAMLVVDLRPTQKPEDFGTLVNEGLGLCSERGSLIRSVEDVDRQTLSNLQRIDLGKRRPLTVRGREIVDCSGDLPSSPNVIIATPPATTSTPEASCATTAPNAANAYLLLNPELQLDLNHQRITSANMTSPGLDLSITRRQCELLYWSQNALRLAHIAARTGMSTEEAVTMTGELEQLGILRATHVSEGMARLQRFFRAGEIYPPYAQQSLHALARTHFHKYGDRRFLTDTNTNSSLSFADAARMVEAVAAALRRDGVTKGSRICVQSAPHLQAAMLFWASATLGAVFVPINRTWRRPAGDEVLAKSRAELMFCDPEHLATISKPPGVTTIVFDQEDADTQSQGSFDSFSHWVELPREICSQPPCEPVGPEDIAVVLYTSGTTGMPKGVEITQGALFRSALLVAQTYGLGREDVMLSPGDFHAIAGLRNPLVCTLMSGASCLLPTLQQRQNIFGLLELCAEYHVTVLKVIPKFLRRLCQFADRVDRDTVSRLRMIIAGSAPLQQETVTTIRDWLQLPVYDYLGITEAAGIAILGDTETGGSVAVEGGVPRDLMAQVVRQDGQMCEVGEVGELRLYGHRLMRGYAHQVEMTNHALRDGWLCTGDLAMWTEKGTLLPLGRQSEAIKVACGDYAYPWEIENAMATNGMVKEVAVCGYTDVDNEDRIAAFVIPCAAVPDEMRLAWELKKDVSEKLGKPKTPNDIYFVDSMPRGNHQKIVKRALVEDYIPSAKISGQPSRRTQETLSDGITR